MKANCADCKSHACYTKGVNCTEVNPSDVIAAYTEDERKLMEAAAYVEGTFYSNIGSYIEKKASAGSGWSGGF